MLLLYRLFPREIGIAGIAKTTNLSQLQAKIELGVSLKKILWRN
jgi:hypothetical protein